MVTAEGVAQMAGKVGEERPGPSEIRSDRPVLPRELLEECLDSEYEEDWWRGSLQSLLR